MKTSLAFLQAHGSKSLGQGERFPFSELDLINVVGQLGTNLKTLLSAHSFLFDESQFCHISRVLCHRA
tara:strand:- start:220 stop:423 length:204 start_codon:yes stop_codon:yes gene_type:complete